MNEIEDRDQVVAAEPSPDLNGSPPATPQPETPEAPRHTERVRNAIAEWTVTILLLLFGTTTLVQAFVIPSQSMEPTLLVGDYLLVDKLAYAPAGFISKYLLPYREPKHGDIIVFRYPRDISQNFVKRVIGVPGDRIKLTAVMEGPWSKKTVNVYRNGVLLNEPYAHYSHSFNDYRDNFPSVSDSRGLDDRALEMLRRADKTTGELVLPPDCKCYFAMGDNRDDSLDSRYWGFVPRANIIGKPLLVYWSYPDAPSMTGSSIGRFFPQVGDVALHFFTRTRWNRMFRPWLLH
jgi:signal peptidase I